jgi:RNA polymerase sigma factor (sigma-70 family)
MCRTLEETWMQYHDLVVARVARRCADLADLDDAVAQVALVLVTKFSELRDKDDLGRWFSTVAKLVCHEINRKHRRHPAIRNVPEPASQRTFPPAACMHQRECAQAVTQCLGTLSVSDRDILRHTVVEGKTCEEYGADLGISAAATRKRKSRALRRLRDCLLKMGVDSVEWGFE